jgi:predicted Abi (CAAX) family protease
MNASTIFPTLLHRLSTAFTTAPDGHQWALSGMLFLLFGLLAVPVGFLTGFLRIEVIRSGRTVATLLLSSLFFPAIAEETLFRVILLPHPSEGIPMGMRLLAGMTSLFLFVASHPLKEWRKRSVRSFTFKDPAFLVMATLLGLACTIAYLKSGSIWPPVVIHWVVVFTWLSCFGGRRRVRPAYSPSWRVRIRGAHPGRGSGRLRGRR